MSVREQLKSGVWRTRELRELLENEEQIKRIVRCSEKFQRLQWAAEKMLVSNKKLAKDNLSQKPKLRDAKLLLALKYKELEKLRSLVQAKQERLEKYSIRQVKACLVQKISHTEQQLELPEAPAHPAGSGEEAPGADPAPRSARFSRACPAGLCRSDPFAGRRPDLGRPPARLLPPPGPAAALPPRQRRAAELPTLPTLPVSPRGPGAPAQWTRPRAVSEAGPPPASGGPAEEAPAALKSYAYV
ncbi:uncharacterized protein ACNS7B_015947 isoform 4-T4 [Menidia menidia]